MQYCHRRGLCSVLWCPLQCACHHPASTQPKVKHPNGAMGRYTSCTHPAGSTVIDAAAIECDCATTNVGTAALRSHSHKVKHPNGAMGKMSGKVPKASTYRGSSVARDGAATKVNLTTFNADAAALRAHNQKSSIPTGRWGKCPGRFTMGALTAHCRPSVPTATWRETSTGVSPMGRWGGV